MSHAFKPGDEVDVVIRFRGEVRTKSTSSPDKWWVTPDNAPYDGVEAHPSEMTLVPKPPKCKNCGRPIRLGRAFKWVHASTDLSSCEWRMVAEPES